MMTRSFSQTTLLFIFLIALLASCKPESGPSVFERPNIVLIMADDIGFSDIGCYGGEIHTPNIDRLAEGGIRFTQFYNNAICVPTRASLLTGLYSQQVGVYANSPEVMKNSVTLAEVLKGAGYRTLMTGKWHAKELPVERGFDRYFGLTDGCCNYFNPGRRRPGEGNPGRKPFPRPWPHWRQWAIDDHVFLPYSPESKDFYTTDAFTDYAIDYLTEYEGEDKPFFLYLAFTAPHYPLHAWSEDVAKYRGKYMMGWDKLREERYQRMREMKLIDDTWPLSPRDPRVASWEDTENKEEWDLKMAVYAAMIDRMDQNIGRLLSKIREMGKENNTLVIFLSDNGGCAEKINIAPEFPPGVLESYRTVDPPWANASNTPFRKYKVWDYEGGIHTPMIAYWPAVIKEKGGITDQVGHIIDIMATFADVAGATYPSTFGGKAITPLEGKSLLPVFQGREREGHEALYWQIANGRHRAIRKGNWKLISRSSRDPWELYDLETDKTELHDLSGKYPEVVDELSKMWEAWAVRCGIPIPND